MSDSIRKIIEASLGDNPFEIKNAIETVIGEKIAEALQEKKIIIANNLVGIKECSDFGGENTSTHPYFGGRKTKLKPPYKTAFSNGEGGGTRAESQEIDIDDFRQFLADELEMEIDNEDVEFLLEDMEEDVINELVNEYLTLSESKKK